MKFFCFFWWWGFALAFVSYWKFDVFYVSLHTSNSFYLRLFFSFFFMYTQSYSFQSKKKTLHSYVSIYEDLPVYRVFYKTEEDEHSRNTHSHHQNFISFFLLKIVSSYKIVVIISCCCYSWRLVLIVGGIASFVSITFVNTALFKHYTYIISVLILFVWAKISLDCDADSKFTCFSWYFIVNVMPSNPQ